MKEHISEDDDFADDSLKYFGNESDAPIPSLDMSRGVRREEPPPLLPIIIENPGAFRHISRGAKFAVGTLFGKMEPKHVICTFLIFAFVFLWVFESLIGYQDGRILEWAMETASVAIAGE